MKKLILLALLLCTTIGQCSLYANDSEPDFWEVFTAQNSGLPNNLVFRIAADHSGRIWMASNGLTLYDHGTWSNFGKTILQIAVDRDNNAWCASDLFGGQLTKCDGNSIVSYNTTTSPGIPSDWVSGVTVDNNNTVWVACSFTGVGEFDGQKWTKHLDPSIGSGNHPMVYDHNNTIWLGTSVGLYRYSEQTWSQFTAEDCSLLADQVSALVCDKNGAIWIATITKGLAHFDGSNWTTYTTTTSGLPSDTLRSLAIDSSGVLWVGTQSGLASYDGTTWSTKTTDNWVLPGNIVMGIAVSPDNDLWFATNAGLLHTSQVLTGIGETNQPGQAALSLTPNPCFGQSTAHLSLQSTAHVRLALYTATGEKVVDITSQLLPAGDHTFSIEGTHLASGVYYCLVTVNGTVEAHKKLVIQH
jgi:ligand-binding sensor domain-containing protein